MEQESIVGNQTVESQLQENLEHNRQLRQMEKMEIEESKTNFESKQSTVLTDHNQENKQDSHSISETTSEKKSNSEIDQRITSYNHKNHNIQAVGSATQGLEDKSEQKNVNSSLNNSEQKQQKVESEQKDQKAQNSSIQDTRNLDEVKNEEEIIEQKIFQACMSGCKSKQEVLKTYPNVLFYAGKLKSNFGRSESIQSIHNRFQNYRILEWDHAYIQWIFPNKYQSNFNSSSASLTDKEIEIFLQEPLLAKRYIRSYEMMLDFYGMSIKNYRTGELKRNANYLERYEDAVCGHNVLRIRRILTSLNNFGFRRYAIQLCNFLKKEIKEGDKPLKRRNGDYMCDWQMYGECEDEGDYKLLQKNCFQTLDELNRVNIYLKQLDEQYAQQLQQQQPQPQPQPQPQQQKLQEQQ